MSCELGVDLISVLSVSALLTFSHKGPEHTINFFYQLFFQVKITITLYF